MRDDFTPEVNDDAEKILVERPEHLDEEIECLVGEIFHRHIRERHRKRKLVREYGLVDRLYQSGNKLDSNSQKTKPLHGLEQLCSRAFLDEFKSNLKREDELRKKIKLLDVHLANGCTKYADMVKNERS